MPTAPSLLAISVGNTSTKLAAFIDGKLMHSAFVRNADADKFLPALLAAHGALQGADPAPVVLASVNPPLAQKHAVQIKTAIKCEVLRVGRDVPIVIGRQLDREAIVGEDRLLNAAAAYDILKRACVVIDAGTAMTIDFIDGAGIFHGGAILPGATMQLHALAQGTAQLPETSFAPPEEPIGHNTVEAMRVGVFHGLRGAVRNIVEQYAIATGMYPAVIATGGDAPVLFADDEFIERVVPELTLLGISASLRQLAQAEDAGEDDE
jgi:type III pantothenate kinase